jgi:hypothetical protein
VTRVCGRRADTGACEHWPDDHACNAAGESEHLGMLRAYGMTYPKQRREYELQAKVFELEVELRKIRDYDKDHGTPRAPAVSISAGQIFAVIKDVEGTCNGSAHDLFVDAHGARVLAARALRAADELDRRAAAPASDAG